VDGAADRVAAGQASDGVVSTSIQSVLERTRARLNTLAERYGATLPEPGERPSTDGRLVLSPHQQWIYRERIDLHSEFNLSKIRDRAKFQRWWVRYMRQEYSAPEEALGWGHLTTPVDPSAGAFGTLITNLMYSTYLLDENIQPEYDLATRYGRIGFIDWFLRRGLFVEELDDTPYVHHILPALSAPATRDESELPVNKFAALVLRRYKWEFKDETLSAGGDQLEAEVARVLNSKAPELLYLYRLLPQGIWPVNRKLLPKAPETGTQVEPATKGANLIGYAHGAFGMGEHVKMAARALANWSDEFSIVDVNAYNHARQPEADILAWVERSTRYRTNIFHVNADAMAGALSSIGPSIGTDRYNIGYWAWELSKVPDAWRPSIDFVDEIWAPSRFIQEAFQEVTDKPVIHMPLSVELSFDSWKRRSHFDLPDNKFLFLYYFDSHSYFERKNPLAAIRAFAKAFPDRDDVGLVIKTQNAKSDSAEWLELMAIAKDDSRIFILNKVMTKGEVLSLQVECDCFVSLHRSEGFGRGPAEAMWLGKPVVVTGYSGNMDFTDADNSLLVDYELIKVKPAEYPFFKGQVWAQPDEDHAARQMRRLLDEPGLARTLGRRAARRLRTEFGSKAIGQRYHQRLTELGAV